jgi:hypothetical protein
MTRKEEFQHAISIDLKNYLIRIHKKTLHSMDNPEYILLLINPETYTLAILKAKQFDSKAHKVDLGSMVNKKSFELYSRALLRNICSVCPFFKKNNLYRIYGEIDSDRSVALFDMSNAIQLNEER